jgi:feruloyl-CoA synthase
MDHAAWPPLAPVRVVSETRADGSILLSNGLPPHGCTLTLPQHLAAWADAAPERKFLRERAASGWREMTYGAASQTVDHAAARLLARGLSVENPLMIIAPNSIDHAVLALAAMRIGVPAAIVSPSYAMRGADLGRLAHAVSLLTPGAVYAGDDAAIGAAMRDVAPALPVLCMQGENGLKLGALPAASGADVQAAAAAVGMASIAKFLFTSGSTGKPKAVPNTHAMMAANLNALSVVWPFLTERPPELLDWLPWSHTFGGNFCFNIALAFGGTFTIDDGKPTPEGIGRTVAALHEISPTIYFNVPVGFAALAPVFETDTALAARFFANVDVLFNAGAALPAATRTRIEAAAARVCVRPLRLLTGWGSTETAPFATTTYFDTDVPDNLGLPVPGVTIKLVPQGTRHELRVRGTNVMQGYWRQPEASAAAFDEEGFYRMGDAGRLADPANPAAGLQFDGRIAENFKLGSGTWVIVATLRQAVIAAADGLITDAAVAGHGGDAIGLLIFPHLPACRKIVADAGGLDDDALARHPAVIHALRAALLRHNATHSGSSMRVARFLIMAEPPSIAEGEMTDKGYLNQRAVLERRRAAGETLFTLGHAVDAPETLPHTRPRVARAAPHHMEHTP